MSELNIITFKHHHDANDFDYKLKFVFDASIPVLGDGQLRPADKLSFRAELQTPDTVVSMQGVLGSANDGGSIFAMSGYADLLEETEAFTVILNGYTHDWATLRAYYVEVSADDKFDDWGPVYWFHYEADGPSES